MAQKIYNRDELKDLFEQTFEERLIPKIKNMIERTILKIFKGFGINGDQQLLIQRVMANCIKCLHNKDEREKVVMSKLTTAFIAVVFGVLGYGIIYWIKHLIK